MEEITYAQKGNGNNCLFLINGFCSGPEDLDEQLSCFKDNSTYLFKLYEGTTVQTIITPHKHLTTF